MPIQKQNIPPPPKSAAPPKKTGPRHPEYSEEDLENAMYACNPRNPNRISLAKAEKMYHVPKSTIQAHILGRKTRVEAHEHEQALTPEEENVLAHYCKIRGYRGVPLEQHEVVAAASGICGKKLGKNWIYAFERRHPELKTRWAKRGEAKRASGLNSANVKGYFEDLKEVLQTEDILPKDIYNMDEKGLEQSGGSLRRRVVVDRAQKEPKIHGDEGRQICTILECISAGGFAIPPLLIHTGAEKDAEWLASNPCDASIAASPNGWTDSDVAAEWLEKVFDKMTRPLMAGSSKRLLIMDGHLSHCTLRFLLYAERNGIVVVCLPPHTTHRLQSLDVGVFNILGKAWSSEVKAAGDKGYKITKFNLLSFYSKARNKAFTPANIRSSFEKCGIWPFNSSVVTEEELAPADNTTIYAAQPLPAILPSFLEIVKEGDPQSVGNNLHTMPASLSSLGTTTPPPLQSLDPNRTTDILIRQWDRPPLPSRYASKKDLLDTITTLNHQLDRAIGQHCADHAQMVLMDKENGDIRNRLYGKTNKGRKVTHVKDGSRILTSAAGIEELARSDHKRVVAAVQKDGNAIFKARLKQLSAREKELAKEQEDDEKRKVKAAEGVMKERKGKMEGMVKRKVRVEEWLKSAEARVAKAKTPATIAKAEKDCERYETELKELGMSMKEVEPQLITATELFTRLSEQRKARLALIEAAEKAYQEAVDQEKRQQEEKDAIDKAELVRKAKLPHRPADPTTLWTTRFQDEEIENPLTKKDQEDVLNGEIGPFFPLGWFMCSVNGVDNTSEDTYQAYHGPDDINTKHIDPSLVAQARLARRNLTEVIPGTATPANPL